MKDNNEKRFFYQKSPVSFALEVGSRGIHGFWVEIGRSFENTNSVMLPYEEVKKLAEVLKNAKVQCVECGSFKVRYPTPRLCDRCYHRLYMRKWKKK